MRAVLAVFAVALVLVTAMAPHVHESAFGSHGCVACVTAGADATTHETPDVAPPQIVVAHVEAAVPEPPVTGAPLGAVPGRSPPPRA